MTAAASLVVTVTEPVVDPIEEFRQRVLEAVQRFLGSPVTPQSLSNFRLRLENPLIAFFPDTRAPDEASGKTLTRPAPICSAR